MKKTGHPDQSHAHSSLLPYLALLLGVIGLSMSAILVRWAAAPGAVSGFYRVAIAAGVMAIPVASHARRRVDLSGRYVAFAVLVGVLFAGDLTAWNTAVLIGNAANATLLANTSPLWVGIGATLLFREKLGAHFWLGLSAALVGTTIIFGRDFMAHPTLGLSDLLGLLASVFYGGFFLATQQARVGLSSLMSWWISTAVSAAALLGLSLILQQPLTGYPIEAYINLIVVALVTQVGAYVSVNYALGHLPASVVSPTLLGQPVLTALLAVPLLAEPLSWVQIVGGLLVLVGIWTIHRFKKDTRAQ